MRCAESEYEHRALTSACCSWLPTDDSIGAGFLTCPAVVRPYCCVQAMASLFSTLHYGWLLSVAPDEGDSDQICRARQTQMPTCQLAISVPRRATVQGL